MLSARASRGCRASFATLIERHYDRIHRLAWRWSGAPAIADDVTQEVCVKLAKAIRNFRGDSKFTTWVHRIAYTTTLDHLERAQRMVAVAPSDIVTLIDQQHRAEGPDTALGGEIWDAVRQLPPQQRDAVLLVYGEEMSHAEAARVMGINENTVSWHVHEAKKKLRIWLEAVG